MAENTQQRLCAILFADIAGYTKHMEADEAGTYAAWRAARDEVVGPTVAAHKGRIVTGDHDPLKLSIGIHLGQVYAEGVDIYGDGVNVAAGLEGRRTSTQECPGSRAKR